MYNYISEMLISMGSFILHRLKNIENLVLSTKILHLCTEKHHPLRCGLGSLGNLLGNSWRLLMLRNLFSCMSCIMRMLSLHVLLSLPPGPLPFEWGPLGQDMDKII